MGFRLRLRAPPRVVPHGDEYRFESACFGMSVLELAQSVDSSQREGRCATLARFALPATTEIRDRNWTGDELASACFASYGHRVRGRDQSPHELVGRLALSGTVLENRSAAVANRRARVWSSNVRRAHAVLLLHKARRRLSREILVSLRPCNTHSSHFLRRSRCRADGKNCRVVGRAFRGEIPRSRPGRRKREKDAGGAGIRVG